MLRSIDRARLGLQKVVKETSKSFEHQRLFGTKWGSWCCGVSKL